MKTDHVLGHEIVGGAHQAAMSTMRLLDRAGVQCRILHRDGPPGKVASAMRVIGGYCDPIIGMKIRRDLQSDRPDLVHLHNFKELGTACIRACLALRIPVVWSVYDYWALCPHDNLFGRNGCLKPEQGCISCYQPKGQHWPAAAKLFLAGRSWRMRRWLNRLDHVFVLSEHSKEMMRGFGLDVPISVAPIPPEPVCGPQPPRDPKRVLFLGWIAPNKGADVFLKAAEIVLRAMPDVQFRMIGHRPNPDYLKVIQPLAAKIGWQLTWMDGVSREQSLDEIARATILVVPEQWRNPQPLVIGEAMVRGTPVLSSYIGGITDLLEGRCGRMSPCASSYDFAEKILDMLENPSQIAKIRRNALKRAEEVFDRDRLTKAYLEVYERCLSR